MGCGTSILAILARMREHAHVSLLTLTNGVYETLLRTLN